MLAGSFLATAERSNQIKIFIYLYDTTLGGYMEKKPSLLTPFDQMVTDEQLQMMKLFIPYLPENIRYLAGIYVKMTEFSKALSLHSYPYTKTFSERTILEEIQPYLPEEYRQFFEMFEIMQDMDLGAMMQGMDFCDMSNMFRAEKEDENERMDESSPTSESGSSETGAD